MVDVQKKIEGLRKNIRELDDRIVKLREKQIGAPKDAMLPGIFTDTVDSLGKDIDESKKKIELNREEIAKAKGEVQPRSTRPASSWRRSRSICCSTACCRATSSASSRCSTRPS